SNPKPATPMTLAAPFTLRASVDPLAIPFKEGSASPNLEAVSTAVVKVSTDAPVTINNISVEQSSESASVQGLAATANVPLGAIMSKQAASVGVAAVAEFVRPASNKGQAESIGKLDMNVSVPMEPEAAPGAKPATSGSPGISGTVKLMDVNTAV